MVIVINGTIGVGKTWIARTLFSQFDRAFCIDGDALGFISSDLLSLISREQVIFQAALHQINFYKNLGVRNFVFDGMFVDPILLETFLKSSDDTYKVFYLMASDRVRNERIKKRGRPEVEKEYHRAKAYLKMQEPYLSSGRLGQIIDTSNKSIEEIVSCLLQEISQ